MMSNADKVNTTFSSPDELFEAIKNLSSERDAGEILELYGLMKQSEVPGAFDYSPDHQCQWISIPQKYVEDIEYIGLALCDKPTIPPHQHPLVRIRLAIEAENEVPNLGVISRMSAALAAKDSGALRNTYFNVEGEAGRDVSAWFDGVCYWGENIGSKRLRFHLGIISVILNRGQRHRFTINGQCFGSFIGRAWAEYID